MGVPRIIRFADPLQDAKSLRYCSQRIRRTNLETLGLGGQNEASWNAFMTS